MENQEAKKMKPQEAMYPLLKEREFHFGPTVAKEVEDLEWCPEPSEEDDTDSFEFHNHDDHHDHDDQDDDDEEDEGPHAIIRTLSNGQRRLFIRVPPNRNPEPPASPSSFFLNRDEEEDEDEDEDDQSHSIKRQRT
jgi:hypothetical protein